MSAAEKSMNRAASDGHNLASPIQGSGDGDSAWSALMDGSLAPAELDELFSEPLDADAFERWDTYRVVGDALKGEAALLGRVPTAEFLRGFQARLAADGEAVQPEPRVQVSVAQTSIAREKRGTAANDGSFRWKMIAMAASVSAVMAVSWGVLGLGGSGAAPVGGPVMASGAPGSGGVVVASPAAPVSRDGAVVVNTPQGPLIRDARLEALMAEHRQYGGMSALQMPAGFLRNATYDAPER